MDIRTRPSGPRVTAVLGPTNTGKTYFAMERMLGHASGIIGFPLRLLARENYDRAVRVKGADKVALITGEEKIIPRGARYFLCTVESMPQDRKAAFLGVDEVQMCADRDRGHVFTDRLLRARGVQETMFMGADTIKPLLTALVPEAEVISRPRFSTLEYAGPRKTTRLPPRSAVVAFSAAGVYALAELVRKHRGGAAVVLGALSPRTRNAQVEMYQAGEVDYLVATDAIGMGLNMNVNHIAFAATQKFDGRLRRHLTAPELAQIAGRAGRHMHDGTFGTTGDAAELDAETVERIENHRFRPLKKLFWRNGDLAFESVEALQRSLAERPPHPGLARMPTAADELLLEALIGDPEIAPLARDADTVRLLWDVCQVPDFGQVLSDAHARLVGRIYRHLLDPGARIPPDWLAGQIARVDRMDGDIETLVQRIANIRIWTYVSYHSAWVDDPETWQERTRDIEDRLSDALHERLTQRFVDRRQAVLMSRLGDDEDLIASVAMDGTVLVEGHQTGRLEGFRYVADVAGIDGAARAVNAAARNALRGVIDARVRRLENDQDDAFGFGDGHRIQWRGEAVGRPVSGAGILQPAAEPLSSDLLLGDSAARVRQRLTQWLLAQARESLAPLFKIQDAALDGAARGIVFQLCEALGSLPRTAAATEIKALSQKDRKVLRELGVCIGRESIYLPALLKPKAAAMRGLLWALAGGLATIPPPPPPGRVSLRVAAATPAAYLEAVGYRVFGGVAVRADVLERLAGLAWNLSRRGPFRVGPELLSRAGCGAPEMEKILTGLGYLAKGQGADATFVRAPAPKPAPRTPRRRGKAASRSRGHFAALRGLVEGR